MLGAVVVGNVAAADVDNVAVWYYKDKVTMRANSSPVMSEWYIYWYSGGAKQRRWQCVCKSFGNFRNSHHRVLQGRGSG